MTRIHRTLCTIVVAIVVAIVAASCGSSAATTSTASTSTTSTTSELVNIGAGIQGVAGLHATEYATGLPHVAALAFDTDGRLWVATAAYTDAGTDAVYLIAASGATPIKVIGGLHTPLGLVWYRGSLYVASKARVDAYSGFTGATFATRRTVVTLPTGVGEVNNLAVAPNGSMLVGVSAPCDHCTPTSKYSGAILAFTPSGGALKVYASGIRAPVGLTFFPGTSTLFVTMDYRDDLGAKTTGDALAVVAAGTAWKNPACYGQGGAACAGVPATTALLDQHAAVSGVAIVTDQLGPNVAPSALVAEWSLGKVQRVALTRSGDSYTGGQVTPFLTGIANPVAVRVAPDGAVFVGDWTSGTIYRVTGSA